MKRLKSYNTKQHEAILAYIASLGKDHASAADIIAHFEKEDTPIGRTTVYRQLCKLADSGKIRKYTIDGVTGACFQYVPDHEDCQTHLHLKCESCGKLQHLTCKMLGDIQRHMADSHAFQINAMKTVLYGKCESC